MAAEPLDDSRSRLIKALDGSEFEAAGELLIAGGGIAGLSLALLLARRGLASHILERREVFSEEGAGIQIGPNGTRILTDLGLAEALKPQISAPQWLIVHDAKTGAELSRMPLNARMPKHFGSPYWTVHREDLHAALLALAQAEPLIRITHDAEVIAVAQNEKLAGVVTREGEQFFGAPLLIGADGLRSTVRTEVSGRTALKPTGKVAFRSVIRADRVTPAHLSGGTHIWLGPDAHVVHYPVRAGQEIAIVVIADADFAGESWSNDARPGDVFDRLKLSPPLPNLLDTAPGWRQWAITEPQGKIALVRNRIALVGDAAHPVLPFLAQGGVLALEDAAVLSDAIATHGAGPEALQVYRTQREERVARVAGASRDNGRIYHADGIKRIARNAVMRFVSGSRLVAKYDWIYGWRA